MAGRLTDLQAVNQILSSVGIRQVASVSSETGSDDASDALRVLNRYNTLVQSRGWPANTLRSIGIAAAGGSNEITFTGTNYNARAIVPLRVECIAPGRFMGNVELAGDKAYVVTENTSNFGSAITVYFDIVHELDFESECPPDLQHVILEEAKRAFQMDRRANEIIDQTIAESGAKAEITANRGRGPRPSEVHRNDTPLVSGSAPRQ